MCNLTYSLVQKPPAPSKEILNKVLFWAICPEPLSTLSTSKNCLIFRNILNFIWALIFFQNFVWFSNCNWFPKIKFFSLKSSLVKNFGKRSMSRWNWGYFWKSDSFLKFWEYWEAQDSLLKMALYLVSLYWGPEVFAPSCISKLSTLGTKMMFFLYFMLSWVFWN